MYKVFINDSLICLLDYNDIHLEKLAKPFDKSHLIELIQRIEYDHPQEIYFFTKDLKQAWIDFRSVFKVKTAAGGKVKNSKGEILFINRFGKWDLPKGHIEKGETAEEGAIREVEEECGISGLKIESKLPTTYHVFKQKGEYILKETFWFNMTTNFEGDLIPQLEEDILDVQFFDALQTFEALQNTYKNILLLFE